MARLFEKGRRWHEAQSEPYSRVLLLQVSALPNPLGLLLTVHLTATLPSPNLTESPSQSIRIDDQLRWTYCWTWKRKTGAWGR
jgi:hypothetical protein